MEELKEALDQMSRASPFLEPLAADPSLRGLMDALALPLRGVQRKRVTLDSLAPKFDALAAPLETVKEGKPGNFSWRGLLAEQPLLNAIPGSSSRSIPSWISTR